MAKMKFVKPQLARPWVERRDIALIQTPGFTMEPKIDGHRCAVVVTSKGVLLLSRTGKKIQSIPWLETWAKRQLSPGTYVDGELVATGGSSNNVAHLRAHRPDLLAYVAFDVMWMNGTDMTDDLWHRRRTALVEASEISHEWPTDGQLKPGRFYIIESLPWSATRTKIGREATRDKWLIQGFEGIMLKDMFQHYKPNSRSGWIKWKWSMFADVLVVGCEAKPSEWRVRPGQYGTDGKLYPEGRHTDPWLAGHVGLEYGYGPMLTEAGTSFAMHESMMQTTMRWRNVPGIGECVVVGSLGVTGPREEMEEFVGKVAYCKCWGVYESLALRHPSPLSYRDWGGLGPIHPPDATLELVT